MHYQVVVGGWCHQQSAVQTCLFSNQEEEALPSPAIKQAVQRTREPYVSTTRSISFTRLGPLEYISAAAAAVQVLAADLRESGAASGVSV